MKKLLLSLLIMLVLSWTSGAVFAKGGGKGKDADAKAKPAAKSQRKAKSRRADANEPTGRRGIRPTRDRQRQRLEMLRKRKERQEMRETRRKGKERLKGGPDFRPPVDELAKGKEHRQQLKAFEMQMAKEVAKHRTRQARLKRIRELAAEENDTKTMQRVDKLMNKERQRSGRKLRRIKERQQKALRRGEKRPGKETRTIKKPPRRPRPKAKERNEAKGGRRGKAKPRDKGTDEEAAE